MTLAFVAFSDPHVGRVWGAHTVPAARQRLTDRYMDPIKEIASKYPNTQIVCGGDWYDRAHNSEATIQESSEVMGSMAAVIAGNHDHVNRVEAVTTLALQKNLANGGSTPVAMNEDHMNSHWYEMLKADAEVRVYLVPHHGTQALFELALLEAQKSADRKGGPCVLVVHCNFGMPGEGKADSNLYLTPPLRELMEQTFDLILVGHEHLHKRVGNTIVMGSTQPCNFGELGPRFCYEIHNDDGALRVEKVDLESQLTHAVIDLNKAGLDIDVSLTAGAELIDLHGVVPIAKAREVQKLVKGLFDNGALAVRMGVEFDKGLTLDGEAVTSKMTNLVDVVREELSENPAWSALFEQALSELNGD